jgi:hypothetical protein
MASALSRPADAASGDQWLPEPTPRRTRARPGGDSPVRPAAVTVRRPSEPRGPGLAAGVGLTVGQHWQSLLSPGPSLAGPRPAPAGRAVGRSAERPGARRAAGGPASGLTRDRAAR